MIDVLTFYKDYSIPRCKFTAVERDMSQKTPNLLITNASFNSGDCNIIKIAVYNM